LIFAALHPQGFLAIPALASIGMGFSLLREWRDSLIAPMVAHAINNGILVGMLWLIL
jgi:membrane protease YdiL (CAAX protease family)